MSTFSRRDFEKSSEELLRKTMAMDAEEVDRVYDLLQDAPDARATVHKLSAQVLVSCARENRDSPAHVRAAYCATSPQAYPVTTIHSHHESCGNAHALPAWAGVFKYRLGWELGLILIWGLLDWHMLVSNGRMLLKIFDVGTVSAISKLLRTLIGT